VPQAGASAATGRRRDRGTGLDHETRSGQTLTAHPAVTQPFRQHDRLRTSPDSTIGPSTIPPRPVGPLVALTTEPNARFPKTIFSVAMRNTSSSGSSH